MTIQKQVAAIYAAYPRKKGKLNAFKAIEKSLRFDNFENLLTATVAYADMVQFKDQQYIPYPATWFNAGSYEDEDLINHIEILKRRHSK